ncbi:MAG: FAD-binding and (Fe-S)-binding domain-containing protein [Thalassovita sp.]
MPNIRRTEEHTDKLSNFCIALDRSGFQGDVETGADSRAVYSTDNSIYELPPRAVVFPRVPDDLNAVMRAAQVAKIAIAARGGGTGTNGQSLTDQIVVDCSRHLTQIEHLDPVAKTVVVQPGVILDQLNKAADKHGLFFGPTVSTSAQATIGGMVATDASGKGSRVFGRTSDHILGMDVVLSDGSDLHVSDSAPDDKTPLYDQPDIRGHIHRTVRDVCTREAAEIARVFPVMNRGLTGYNLKDVWDGQGQLTLTRLLAGSEGTLALTKRVTLQLLPQNPHRALMVVAYDDGLAALGDAQRLVTFDPSAVEFIDDKILDLAQDDDVWRDLAPILKVDSTRPIKGMNFVEVQAKTETDLTAAVARLQASSASAPTAVVTAKLVTDSKSMSQIWALRKKCVGLLGRMAPKKQGMPFVEDAAVPPENLCDFVDGFRQILESHNLAFGMFGHADVGCVHVRPALDMKQTADQALIRKVSDAVEKLARAQGGVIWGEHGKGFRGEYVPTVFGPRLYRGLCEIKAAFDPQNLLNPGKIATPNPSDALQKIDAVPMRGQLDATIGAAHLDAFDKAVRCNGNGQCFNRDVDDLMCPSYKATNDRRFAPKGRAALLREWMRLKAVGPSKALTEIENALLLSFDYCLSCKACSNRCPVKVDIPAMKAKFYHEYYGNTRRPLRHYLVASMEHFAPVMRRFPRVSNLGLQLAAPMIKRAGLVDLPAIHPPKPKRNPSKTGTNGKTILLVEDSFNACFNGSVIDAANTVLTQLGYHVERISDVPNGKAQSVLGFKKAFERTAQKRFARLTKRASEFDHLIELEPAVHGMSADEYAKQGHHVRNLISIDKFLAQEEVLKAIGSIQPATARAARLITHCTERASDPHIGARWQNIFAQFAISLTPIETGCCGMAGMFGHEGKTQDISRQLYEQHWAPHLSMGTSPVLATGFSCRSQVKRFADQYVAHPIEFLAEHLCPSTLI